MLIARADGVLRRTESGDLIDAHAALLPFYAGHRLVRLRRSDWPRKRMFYYIVADQQERAGRPFFVRLNGESSTLHDLNERAPVDLEPTNVAAYLRFFCFFVRGEHGLFAIVEQPDDGIAPADMPAAMRKVFDHAVRPIEMTGRGVDGEYVLSAIIWYDQALFTAHFDVQEDGVVAMIDDDPVAADLPLAPDWPIT